LSPAEAKDLERFPSQNKVASEVYTVKKGDTFEKLFGEKWRVIARFNRLDKDHLFAGQKIKVPVDLEQAAGYSPLPAFFEEAKNEEKFIYHIHYLMIFFILSQITNQLTHKSRNL